MSSWDDPPLLKLILPFLYPDWVLHLFSFLSKERVNEKFAFQLKKGGVGGIRSDLLSLCLYIQEYVSQESFS
jgi:hypothetical protein